MLANAAGGHGQGGRRRVLRIQHCRLAYVARFPNLSAQGVRLGALGNCQDRQFRQRRSAVTSITSALDTYLAGTLASHVTKRCIVLMWKPFVHDWVALAAFARYTVQG